MVMVWCGQTVLELESSAWHPLLAMVLFRVAEVEEAA